MVQKARLNRIVYVATQLAMKLHNCLIKIANNSGMDMKLQKDWFDSGRVADGFEWPHVIETRNHADVLCYEKDFSLAGCSGYVTYKMGTTDITISFSNPILGWNKLGVGTTYDGVWNEMSDHDYNNFVLHHTVSGKHLAFYCKCTGGATNTCTVKIESA